MKKTGNISLQECARIMGVTTSRAGQLERQALDKLRNHPEILEIAREMGILKQIDTQR